MCQDQAKRILIIGGGEAMLRAAKEAEVNIISIQKEAQFKEAFFKYTDQTFIFDYEDIDALLHIVKGIYKSYPFQYVISMTETGLLPAAAINDMLSLPGNSQHTVRLLKDKMAMRNLLNDKGISPVAAATGTSKEDINGFGDSIGWPIIVKPIDGAGSLGIFYIANAEQVNDIWEQIQVLDLESFIMEEFLEGREVSVEAFSSDGNHTVISVTDKITLSNFVEVGHTVPAQISNALKIEIVETVISMLNAVGLKEGPSHTELRLTKNGPKIIESHNRVGGDKIHELVNLVYGLDMVEMACSKPFGKMEELKGAPKPKGVAAIRFLTPPSGVVKNITGAEEIKNHPAIKELVVSVKPGEKVSDIKHSLDRPGYIIVQANNLKETVDLCDQMMGKIQIEIS